MDRPRKILVVEDNPGDLRLFTEMLADGGGGSAVESVETLSGAIERLGAVDVDLVMLDLSLPDSQGIETFAKLHHAAPRVAVVILTGNPDVGVAVLAVEQGAQDFLVKGRVDSEQLTRAIAYAVSRKQAEEELRESEARYRALAEGSPLAVLVSRNDKDNDDVVLANATCVKLFGASSPEELIGRSALELFDPDSQALVREHVREATRETVPFLEARIVRLDGTLVDVDLSASPLLDQGLPAIQVILRDITERKRTQAQVARLAAIVTSSPDAILTKDLDEVITSWNPAAEALYGYAAQEIIGTNMEVLVPSEHTGEHKRLTKRLLKGEKLERFETQRKRKDGSLVDVSLTLFPIRNDAGDTVAISVMAQDITERKQAEEALAASERFAQRMLDTSPNLIYIYDMVESRNVYANREIADFLGYTAQQVLDFGSALFEHILHPDDAALVEEHHARMRARAPGDDDVEEVDYRMRHSCGQWRWLHSRDVPFGRDESGAVTQILGFTEDITERKQAEQERLRSEKLFRDTFEQAAVGIAHVGTDGTWLRVNQRLCDMLGYTREELSHLGFADITHPDDVDEDVEALHRLLAGDGQTYHAEKRYLRKDGSIIWVDMSVALVRDEDGAPDYNITVVEDITRRKTAEETLAATVRALKALSSCNETLIRAEVEQTLLADVCKVGVEQGGYRMVWVGYAQDDEAKSVKPMAFAGDEGGFLSAVSFNWGEQDTEHNGPPGHAIRTKEPVVMHVPEEDPLCRPCFQEASAHGYNSGASFPLLDSAQRAFGVITFVSGVHEAFENEEMALLQELASDLAYGIEALRTKELRVNFEADLLLSNERLQGLLKEVVAAMSRIVETRDPYTQGHQVRAAGLAKAIAAELGMSEHDIEGIQVAALVHDVGKMGVPAEILTKPGTLTDTEFQLIKQHSQAGYEILKDIDFAWPVAETVLQHHERLDGSGYPRGLKGDEIIRGARVLAVADVVEAMATHRPYRPALSLDAALAEVTDASRFDSEVAAACVRLFESGRFSLEG